MLRDTHVSWIYVRFKQYGVNADEYVGFPSGAAGRDMAAYLCRRYTTATLRELSDRFGLSHPDRASDLVRRGAKRIEQSSIKSCWIRLI